MDQSVTVQQAKDLLWRRETRKECSDKQYRPSDNPDPNKVVIEHLQNLANVETVLFTKIGKNIKKRTPEYLADLAICSARRKAGKKQEDGISYLISVNEQGIQTPLMPKYEAAILQKTKAQTLKEAYDKIRSGDA
ncbi:MAG TPA: hypothetical protein ENI79_02890 [Rhodospirillales bacterium]|nr:hypothetical protein [Rhodospirillales bacterium]